RLEDLGEVADPEVIFLEALELVTLAEEVADLLLGDLHVHAVAHPHSDGVDGRRGGLGGSEHPLVGGQDRDDHDIVLILTPARLALALEHADHGEGHAGHAHHHAHRIGAAEHVLGHCLAQEHHPGGAPGLLGGEPPPPPPPPPGSAPPNTFSATVWPRSTTLAAPSASSGVNQRPATTGHWRVSSYSGVVPWMPVDQFVFPHTT